ncbi:MAG TPA: glycosyltransferase family 39 protein [Caulobacteraceae bacterium]|nr:glycosyltransferase family 39 protein [Caulobacteraceae bacterium]
MAESPIERFLGGGWRGPLAAAIVAFLAVLPGLIAIPVLDRDEARFAQSTAQMLETGDPVSINLQDAPRSKKPVGIHWLQALSVGTLSSVEARQIWAYRIPSLLGAMVAAAACAWGAAAFFGSTGGAVAGALLGSSLILSTEGFIAKTDAALCGAVTLMMAALARIYASSKDEAVARTGTRVVFWAAMAVSILLKGPIGPMVAGLTLLALWAWDRKAEWMASLGWTWGIALILLVVGPWAWAITVTTDGGFWTGAVMGDMLSKIASGQESHGAPPGLHAALSLLLLLPGTVLLPAGLVLGWKMRAETGVRFALCWLAPAWLVFELTPTKLPHYTLPLYGALAWLMAAALQQPIGRISRIVGASLGALAAVLLAAAGVVLALRYGSSSSLGWAVAAAAALAGSLAAALVLILFQRRSWIALGAMLGFGILGHDALAAGLAPTLSPLWLSQRTAAAVKRAGIDPRNGTTPGPVSVAGYGEPSIVFLLGTRTELGTGEVAAAAISEGRPAVVEAHELKEFGEALRAQEARAALVGEVRGIDYSKGKPVDLFLYRSLESGDPR